MFRPETARLNHSTVRPAQLNRRFHPARVSTGRFALEVICPFRSSACPTRFSPQSKRLATPPPLPSKSRRSPTFSRAATCSASRRPAPARPPPSCCRCSPCSRRAARARMPRTLILEPTRELAAQVEESFDKYGANQKLNVALIIGGVSFDDQDAKLTRGVDVLIATPGRLLDHSERGRLLLTGVELLVIDEADRMLDMGFIPDIERICKLVPFTRQTLFFTATMPPEIQRITDNFLHNPVRSKFRAGDHGRQHHPAPGQDRPRAARKARHAAPPDPLRRELQERDHLLQPQARSRAAAPLAAAPRVQCGRAARRPGPVGPHGGARRVPQGRGEPADRVRRGGARPRHSRREPRLQFRRAASCRRLCAPHRPHRPRRHAAAPPSPSSRPPTAGRRRDREADRPEHPLDGRARRVPRATNGPTMRRGHPRSDHGTEPRASGDHGIRRAKPPQQPDAGPHPGDHPPVADRSPRLRARGPSGATGPRPAPTRPPRTSASGAPSPLSCCGEPPCVDQPRWLACCGEHCQSK